MTLVIGLTGSIATGKSTVSDMFADYDIPVIDADQLSRIVVRPGEKGHKQIVDTFGETILQPDQTIDRQKLGQIVFEDDTRRNELNAIVHPLVREEMLKQRDAWIESDVPAVVLDIPLLFESNLTGYADKIMVVAVDYQTQLERLMQRDHFDQDEAASRIRSQMPISQKAERADVVIDNNRTQDITRDQLQTILKTWEII